jgi:NADPH2:quinone reductase
MKAMRIVPGPGGGRLEVQDAQVPTPGAGQVLVRVRAAGVNRGEVNQVRRATAGAPQPSGVEFAGEVAATGEGARAMGHGPGGHAQYVLAQAGALMPVPPRLDWIAAAAFPNVFMTAHDALVTNGRLAPGEAVLVNAASSGIGTAAIQIARLLGAGTVIATTRSAGKLERLRGLGADVAVDTSATPQCDAVEAACGGRGVDLVVDSIGGSVFEDNLRSLAVRGRLVHIGRMGGAQARIDLEQLWLKRLQLIGVTFRTRSEAERIEVVRACARDLLGPLGEGRIALPVDQVLPLERLADAHALLESGRHFGKVVLRID